MDTAEHTRVARQVPEATAPQGRTEPRYVETASATTDPDNANSGSKPLVIAGVGFFALLLVSLSLASCASGLADAMAIRRVSYGSSRYTTGGGAVDELDDLDELLREQGVGLTTNNRRPTGNSYLY